MSKSFIAEPSATFRHVITAASNRHGPPILPLRQVSADFSPRQPDSRSPTPVLIVPVVPCMSMSIMEWGSRRLIAYRTWRDEDQAKWPDLESSPSLKARLKE